MTSINFYTDGACDGNKSGGWSFYCPQKSLRVCGHKKDTTNNEMELMAISKVIKYVISSIANDTIVNIHSDSAWAIGAITKEWELQHHKELVEKLKNIISGLASQRNILINFVKVKGHSGLEENEVCDSLAVIMSKNASN